MMRFTGALATVVGAALVVPAATGGGADVDTLGDALASTARSLEALAGLQEEFESQTATSETVAAVRALSEQPIPDGLARQSMLGNLRQDLAELYTELDLLEAEIASSEDPRRPALLAPWEGVVPIEDPIVRELRERMATEGQLTVGLDPSLRAMLAAVAPPASVLAQTSAVAGSKPTLDPAAALIEGRKAYRAGEYARAVALLEPHESSLEALHWLARSREKLGQLDVAEALYRRVVESRGPLHLVERARTDLEFLLWRRRFEGELTTRIAPTAEVSQP